MVIAVRTTSNQSGDRRVEIETRKGGYLGIPFRVLSLTVKLSLGQVKDFVLYMMNDTIEYMLT